MAEIEFTHHCNILCGGCAIREDIKQNKYTLSSSKIINFLYEAKKAGITSYSLTGGEPFTEFETVKQVIRESPIDLLKINTNGFVFSTPKKTHKIFQDLKKAGFSKTNKHLKSWIHISIGQQNATGIPIENSVFACMEFFKIFPKEKAGISFIVFSLDQNYAKKIIKQLMVKYQEMTGRIFPQNETPISLISNDIRNCSTSLKLNIISSQQKTTTEMINYYLKHKLVLNCSSETLREKDGFISPRLLLRADGSVYACSGFVHLHYLGHLGKQSLDEMLRKANQDVVIKTVYKSGLPGLLKLAEKNYPGIGAKKISISNGPCDICKLLSEQIQIN